MDITFRSTKLEKQCTDTKRATKTWGPEQARKIRQRLDDLRAAPHLGDFRSLPGRCHELRGDRAGQLSLDLVHLDRLLFKPNHDPVPTKPDGGLDWDAVTAIDILEVVDTHD